MDDIAVEISEKFGQEVSGSWVSRIMKKYDIRHKEPKPPKVKKVRISKSPKPPKVPGLSKATEQPGQSSWVPQYSLPAPGQYPSFREDLQQALVGQSRPLVDMEQRVIPAPPPAPKRGRGRPPNPPEATPNEGHKTVFDGFGILRLPKTVPTAPVLPPISTQHSFPPQYRYPLLASSASSSEGSQTPSDVSSTTPTENRSGVANKSSNINWRVLKVVELP
jgi:hypothetical protein